MIFPNTLAIILAAGSSRRFGADKITLHIGGLPVIYRSVTPFLKCCSQVVITLPADDRSCIVDCLPKSEKIHTFVGGDTRHQSLQKALEGWQALVRTNPDISEPRYVLIHDAARPCVDTALIERVQATLDNSTSCAVVPVLRSYDTVYKIGDTTTLQLACRESLRHAQTPQGFHYSELVDFVTKNSEDHYTDEVSLFIASNKPVITVPGNIDNIKITTPEDSKRVARFFADSQITKTGFGVDIHRIVQGTSMILGGYRFTSDYALLGHSDADVVLHALCDAIYGVIADGDIGVHFPPSEQRWQGEPSATFLCHALSSLSKAGGALQHIDLTIVAEYPKITPHRKGICKSVADLCGLLQKQVGLKATTSECLGFTGRGEGITAFAQITASFNL